MGLMIVLCLTSGYRVAMMPNKKTAAALQIPVGMSFSEPLVVEEVVDVFDVLDAVVTVADTAAALVADVEEYTLMY